MHGVMPPSGEGAHTARTAVSGIRMCTSTSSIGTDSLLRPSTTTTGVRLEHARRSLHRSRSGTTARGATSRRGAKDDRT